MRMGSANRLARIERLTGEVDPAGQPIQAWELHCEAWANIRTQSGIRLASQDAPASIAKYSVRIRYQRSVDAAMRVVIGGVAYRILAVLHDEARHRHTDLVCEVVNG